MPTSATRLLASSIALTACASCSGPPAPYCDDGEVEELVADLVRERLSRRASYQYWISPESLAELEGRIDTAAKKIQDLIDAEKLIEGRASAAQQEAYRAATETSCGPSVYEHGRATRLPRLSGCRR